MPQGKIFNLETINGGFIRPSSSDDWAMAYCQAELYAQYMLDHFGDDALAKMLAAYADNLNTRAAIQRAFGVGQEEFERGYVEYLAQNRGRIGGLAPRDRAEAGGLGSIAQRQARRSRHRRPAGAGAICIKMSRRKPGRLADAVLKKHPKHPLATYVVAQVDSDGRRAAAGHRIVGRVASTATRRMKMCCALLASLKLEADKPPRRKNCMNWGPKNFRKTCSGCRRWRGSI